MAEKYKNMLELAEAFRSGELNNQLYKLVLDNDGSWLSYVGPIPEGMTADSEAADIWLDERHEECRDWFSGNGYSDLKDACEAAGIPCDWC